MAPDKFENGAQHCYEMAPDKLENGTQRCVNKFDCRLFTSRFSQFAFYLSLSHSVTSKSLAQPFCKCRSLSVSLVLNVDSPTRDVRDEQHPCGANKQK